MMRTTLLLSLVVSILVCVQSYGEPASNGHPTYNERANLNLVNIARVGPQQYKTIYLASFGSGTSSVFATSTYPAVNPLYWEPRLGQSSYAHSLEMGVKNYFAHTSYDGTDPFTRIGTYYSGCCCSVGENIAAGFSAPLDTNNQWLCDGSSSSCAADGSGFDGHRSNIMNSNYGSIGVGYSYAGSSTYHYYWTQDFGGSCTGQNSSIYSGSHVVFNGNVRFAAVYYSSVPVSSAVVVVNGVSHALSLEAGSTTRGSWAFSTPTSGNCSTYFFSIGGSSGAPTRYPTIGAFYTNGDSCSQDYTTLTAPTPHTSGSMSLESLFSALLLSLVFSLVM